MHHSGIDRYYIYILAVYFGSVGIKTPRYALTCGLFADFVGIVSAILLGYLFFHSNPVHFTEKSMNNEI